MAMSLLRSRLWLLLLSACVATSCAKLDTSRAHRCESHADCKPGRACQKNTCSPISTLAIEGSDAAFPIDSSARDASTSGNQDASMDGGGTAGSMSPPPSAGGGGSRGRDSSALSDAGDAKADGPATLPEADAGPDAASDRGLDSGGNDAAIEPNPCLDVEFAVEGVALWLDATLGVVADDQGRVEQWLDRSPHRHVAQATGLAPDWPLLVPADGFASVRFGVVEGTSITRRVMIADHASLQFGSDAFAIIAVLRHHTPTGGVDSEMEHGVIFAKTCECGGFVGPALFANDLWPHHLRGEDAVAGFAFGLAARTDYSTQSIIGGFNDDRLHVVVAQRAGDEITVTVDGSPHVATLVSSTLDVSTPGVPVTIGAHGVLALQALEGDIRELIVLRGPATARAAERADCLLRKHGIR
jgi:hypothetical protein